jgi:hypothetical protein
LHLSEETVIARFKDNRAFNVDCNDELEFMGSRFSPLCEVLKRSLTIDDFKAILSHGSLRIESEDWLCLFLIGLFDSDDSFFSLFEFVHFEFVSEGTIEEFLKRSPKILSLLNFSIWERISARLVLPVYKRTRNDRVAVRTFPLRREAPFDGIFAYLRQECGGNIHDRGVVNMTASSTSNGHVKNLADGPTRSWFPSANEKNSWVKIDFKNARVGLTDYSIATQLGCTA